MAWVKLESEKRFGRSVRTSCGVSKIKTGAIKAIFPAGLISEGRYEILQDGARLGFRPTIKGGYKVTRLNRSSKAMHCTVPASCSLQIPFGTTDVPHHFEDGMLVLNLSALQLRAAE